MNFDFGTHTRRGAKKSFILDGSLLFATPLAVSFLLLLLLLSPGFLHSVCNSELRVGQTLKTKEGVDERRIESVFVGASFATEKFGGRLADPPRSR